MAEARQIARPVIAGAATRRKLLGWLSAASTTIPLSVAASAEEAGVRGYWQEPSGAVIQVADCTQGLCLNIVALPPGDRLRIFESFVTTKEGGVGIGLSICRSIIEGHGGRLWADANQPRGAALRFALPVKH